MEKRYTKTWPDQVVLVAIGVGRTDAVLGYRGSGISTALLTEENRIDDPREQFPLIGYPGTEPGFHVPRGKVTLRTESLGPESDEDFELTGRWSKATGEDVAGLMGIMDPPIETPEEASS